MMREKPLPVLGAKPNDARWSSFFFSFLFFKKFKINPEDIL